MPKVSIIMPSLNVGKYIKQCIESVINQTLEDIEIICVDAGSTDGTLEILRDYSEKDNRIKLIISEKRSYGYQMNIGISIACGEYIGVVETDDYIDSEMYMTLYNIAVDTNADYVKGNGVHFEKLGNITRTGEIYSSSDFKYDSDGIYVIESDQMEKLILKDYYLWSGIYKNDFIKKIKLNETPGAANQDIGFLIQTMMNAEKVVYINKPFYHYRQDNLGASFYNRNTFKFIVEEYDYVNRIIKGQSNRFKQLILCKMLRQVTSRVYAMAYSGEIWNNSVEYLNIISDNLKQLYDNHSEIIDVMNSYDEKTLKLLTDNPISLYEHFKKYADIYKSQIEEFIKKLNGSKQIVLFGCGQYCQFAHQLLESRGCTVVACCDNDEKRWGTFFQGVKIMQPKEAFEKLSDAVYVITNRCYKKEIRKQLETAGIMSSKIVDYYEITTNSLVLKKIW